MNKRRYSITCLILCFLTWPSGLAADNFQTTPRGAQYRDLKTGTGESVAPGDVATIHFVGWLDENGQKGKEIYNTRRDGTSVSFVVGTERVIQGWNEGVIGMRQGGKRLLLLPPELGYGARGVEHTIPPNARLIFVIDLVRLQKTSAD